MASATEVSRVFGTTGRRTATQESLCTPDCAEVTSALYLLDSDLQDTARLDCLLMKAVGLISPESKDC